MKKSLGELLNEADSEWLKKQYNLENSMSWDEFNKEMKESREFVARSFARKLRKLEKSKIKSKK